MNRRPLEPLDAEEAALAEQLARLGPHGEPSPRLDARILAAAHDAVSEQARPRRRTRWPLGLGVAASALLAVGIAWQLRPTHESPLDREFAAADADAAAAVAAADASAGSGSASGDAAARGMAPPPPPLESVAAPLVTELPANASPSAAYNPPAALPSQAAVAKTRPALPAPRRSVVESAQARRADAPPLVEPTASDSTNLDSVAVAAAQMRSPATAALPSPPPPPAPPASTRTGVSADENFGRSLGGVVADPETYAEIAAQREQARAQHARNAAASAERQETRARRASEASSDMQDAIAPATAAAASAPAVGNVDGLQYGRNAGATPVAKSSARNNAFAPGVTRNSLKRTDLQLPVVEDTKLDADDWLERIRLRRDLGDRASAVESLLRFRQAHPFQKTPEDLQELLAE